MPTRRSYDYAILRVVPRVERGEFVNAGIILLSREAAYIGAAIALDEARLRALDPDADTTTIREHLDAIAAIANGDPNAGPIARFGPAERFHWLTAPRSTILQPSPVHSGQCEDPAAELRHLRADLVSG